MQHGEERLPICAYEKRRETAFQSCDSPCRFSVPRRNPVPNSPDILPTLPPDAVKECELQVIRLVAIPAIGNVYHVPRFEPLESVYLWRKGELVLSPSHDVVGDTFIVRPVLGFESERMARLIGSIGKSARNTVLRVTVDPVSANLPHERCNRVRPRLFGVACSLVPHHHGKKN